MKGMIKTLKSGFGFDTRIFSLLFVFSFIVVIAISLILKYWGKGEFFEGITVEAFGMLFDIAVLGILYSIFKNRDENKRNIKRYLEEIDDFRGWDEKEAMYRIVGNIKRLIKLGEKNLLLRRCYLANAELATLDLQGAILQAANLQGANLGTANLSGAKLQVAKLQGANLSVASLRGARLDNAQLEGANLQGAFLTRSDLRLAHLSGAKLQESILQRTNLDGTFFAQADLEGADLEGPNLQGAFLIEANLKDANIAECQVWGTDLREADLQGADLTGTEGLTFEQLSKVKSLWEVKGLDLELEARLRKEKPELFEEPKEKTEW